MPALIQVKQVFVRLPAASCLPKARAPYAWYFKRVADWLVAAGLILFLSPLLLLLAGLVYFNSPGAYFL